MVLTTKEARKIESYFYEYANNCATIKDLSTEIAGRYMYAHQLAPARTGWRSDPTAQRAAELDERTRTITAQKLVVDLTLHRFADTAVADYIRGRYFKGMSTTALCMQLFVERRTIFNWRQEVLCSAAIVAAQVGIFAFETPQNANG